MRRLSSSPASVKLTNAPVERPIQFSCCIRIFAEIIDVLKTVEQLIGICGYAQIPHILGALNDLAVADIALAALRILVREDDTCSDGQ